MGSISFRTEALALAQSKALSEVEKIKQSKSVNAFVNKYSRDKDFMLKCVRIAEPSTKVIKDTIENVEHASRKIKIGTVAEPSIVDNYTNKVHEVCPQMC